MQQMIKDFGTRSRAIEVKYEEEVQWLRRQIEEKGVVLKPRENPPPSGGLPAAFSAGGAAGSITLPSFASLGGAGVHAGSGQEVPSSVSVLAGAAGRDQAEATKAVDGKGRPLDDWNVVHNPNSSTKMHIELRHTLEHDSVVCCVRFSNDGRYIATGCNKTAVLYDAVTGKRIAMFSNEGVLESQVALDNLTCGGELHTSPAPVLPARPASPVRCSLLLARSAPSGRVLCAAPVVSCGCRRARARARTGEREIWGVQRGCWGRGQLRRGLVWDGAWLGRGVVWRRG